MKIYLQKIDRLPPSRIESELGLAKGTIKSKTTDENGEVSLEFELEPSPFVKAQIESKFGVKVSLTPSVILPA